MVVKMAVADNPEFSALFKNSFRFGEHLPGDKITDGILLMKRGVVEYQRSEEHTSELQSHLNLVCRLLLEKKK